MKTQQCCVLTGAIVTLLVGISLAVIGKAWMEPDVVLQNMESGFAYVVFVLGICVAIVGCVGVIGSLASSWQVLATYSCCNLSAAITGLVTGGVLLATVNAHGEELQQSCSVGQQSGTVSSGLAQTYQSSYNSMHEALVNCRQNGLPSALGLQDCGQLGKDKQGHWYYEDPFRDLFMWAEETSGCAGFCIDDIPLFAFPEQPSGNHIDQSSKQRRRSACFAPIVSALEGQGDTYAGVILGLSALLFVAICGAVWIVCYPPPRKRKGYIEPDYNNRQRDDHETGALLSDPLSSDDDEESYGNNSDEEYYSD